LLRIGNRKGSITIFATIVMSVIIAFVGVLVDAARVRMARPVIAFGVESSLDSVLAGYEETLKDLYGIFAMAKDDPEMLQEEFENYLSKILMTQLGIDKSGIGEEVHQELMAGILGKDGFSGAKFLNLYDFNIEKTDLTRQDNLIEGRVIRTQILEHMKYRAPKEWMKGFLQKLTGLKEVRKQTEVIQNKVELDKNLDTIKQKMQNLSTSVKALNESMKNFEKVSTLVDTFVDAKSQKINHENFLPFLVRELERTEEEKRNSDTYNEEGEWIEDLWLKRQIENLRQEISSLTQMISKSEEMARTQKEEILKMIAQFRKDGERIKTFAQQTQEQMREVQGELDSLAKKVDGELSVFGDKIRKDLNRSQELLTLEDLKRLERDSHQHLQTVEGLEKAILEHLEVESWEVDPGYEPKNAKRLVDLSKDPKEIKREVANIVLDGAYYQENFVQDLNPLGFTRVRLQETLRGEDPIGDIRNAVDEKNQDVFTVDEKMDKSRNEAFKELQKDLPSRGNGKENRSVPIHRNNFDGGQNLGTGMLKESSDLALVLERDHAALKDELYINEYVLTVFKHATAVIQGEWELDFRGQSKGARSTFFDRGEVEYILGGSGSENVNLAMVSAQIFLLRFALNSIYVYTNAELQKAALSSAIAISGWWSGGLAIPVMAHMILLTLAFSESFIDVKWLLEGKNVPIFKTKDTWVLGIGGAKNYLTQEGEKKMLEAANQVMDFVGDGVHEIKEKSFALLENTIEEQVDLAIEKAFYPLENLLLKGEDSVQKMIKDLTGDDFLEVDWLSGESEEVNQLIHHVYSLAQEKATQERGTIEQQMVALTSENFYGKIKEIEEEIKSFKEHVKTQVSDELGDVLTALQKELGDQIDALKDQGKEQLEKTVGDFFAGFKGNTGVSQGGVQNHPGNRLLSFSYRDYLRILLLRINSDEKIQRIQDLIQLNMQQKNGYEGFLLEDFYARLDVSTEVSVKYLFLTRGFVPKSFKTQDGSKHNLKILKSRGY
jgi:hypothetical protein